MLATIAKARYRPSKVANFCRNPAIDPRQRIKSPGLNVVEEPVSMFSFLQRKAKTSWGRTNEKKLTCCLSRIGISGCVHSDCSEDQVGMEGSDPAGCAAGYLASFAGIQYCLLGSCFPIRVRRTLMHRRCHHDDFVNSSGNGFEPLVSRLKILRNGSLSRSILAVKRQNSSEQYWIEEHFVRYVLNGGL